VPSQPFATDPAWMTGPAGAVLAVLEVAYAFSWLSLPVALLVVGIGQLRATTPLDWQWPAIWTGAVVSRDRSRSTVPMGAQHDLHLR
jgi:hypothetical protein